MLLAVLGTMEIIIIVAVVLLVLGPSKLPQLGEGVGKMLRGFKKEMKQIDEDKKEDNAQALKNDKDGEDEIDVTPKKTAESSSSKA